MNEFSIAILIPYFGKWPDWIKLFFETLKRNADIDFIIYTDCDTSITSAPNIIFRQISFTDYVKKINAKMNFDFNPQNAYKLCDIRPMLGFIHEDDFKNYDFYGWCDTDLLFGDIRSFYTNTILKENDVFSTHANRISGHFALFKNTEANRNMYEKIYGWREALSEPQFVGIDEYGITNAYLMTAFDKFNEKFKTGFNNFFSRYLKNQKLKYKYFVEQYTTPFLPIKWIDGTRNNSQPSVWFYKNGEITNDRDKQNFIYIHFMNFKNSQWRHDGSKAPWEEMDKICYAKVSDMINGIRISNEGIYPLYY